MGKRYAGLNIPVFSLRSKKSLGSGEFLDLIPLIDWAVEAGLKVLQLLPIHDTSVHETDEDRFPYAILSMFSLHPIYLNIQQLAPEFEAEFIQPLVNQLNVPNLEYKKTYFAKKEFLKMLYIMRGDADLASKEFAVFFREQASHIKAYAAFCVLRNRYKTSDFRKWGEHASHSELLVEKICETEEAKTYMFIQFHLHKQMKQVKKYAQKNKILLKGDFAMGVHSHSVDAWRFSEYFREGFSMGAPPDFYNPNGQNWGFPTYNWDEIKEDGYYWIKERLKWMEQYFDIIRIDHVLGYFRLWEIPQSEIRGLLGCYNPAEGYEKQELFDLGLKPPYEDLPKEYANEKEVRKGVSSKPEREKLFKQMENRLFLKRRNQYHPRAALDKTALFHSLSPREKKAALAISDDYFLQKQDAMWEELGLEKLSVFKKETSLLLCAEDIGLVPPCVDRVLKKLHILNLYIQRIPKTPSSQFDDPEDFPEDCVCMPSNHDTAPLRQWWEESDPTVYYHSVLNRGGNPPKELTPELAQQILQGHLESKARLAIFLLQDLLSLSDGMQLPHPEKGRINDPAENNNNWKWRSHVYVEELLLAKGFTRLLKSMIKEANR